MKSIFTILFTSLTLISCGMNEDELSRAGQAAYEGQDYEQAIRHFEELIDRFPDGKNTEQALFLLATIYSDNVQNHRMGIATYRRLRELFPNGEKAPAALFLIGFVYNNHLNLYDSAKIVYEEFLMKYPNHDMAVSAQFELDNLGRSTDDLFKPRVAEQVPREKATRPKRGNR
jgi:TolA-binding protein